MTSLFAFLSTSRRLLALERLAEDEKYKRNRVKVQLDPNFRSLSIFRDLSEKLTLGDICDAGLALQKLRLESIRGGLFGRTLAELTCASQKKDATLPAHKFTSGDITAVFIGSNHRDPITTGIVNLVSERSITVALDNDPDFDENHRYGIVKLPNDVTYKRLEQCLDDLKEYSSLPGRYLVDLCFHNLSLPQCSKDDELPVFISTTLNESQKQAVAFALNVHRPLTLVHGPPGTGKTTTVIEIILQACQKQGQKVLVAGPSNVSVDNIVERLGTHLRPGELIRLGHPARLFPGCQKHSLDAVMMHGDAAAICADVRDDIDKNLVEMRRLKHFQQRKKIRDELKTLRHELAERESKAMRETLRAAKVIACTLTGGSKSGPLKVLLNASGFTGFDLVIIDECAQALELADWQVLLHGKRTVLVGDPCQLPPTIISRVAAKEGFEVTLMERLLKEFKEQAVDLVRMLTVQYRMHKSIMAWPSEKLYENKLVADASVAAHRLCDLPNVQACEETEAILWMIDTDGCQLLELESSDEFSESSKGNVAEVKLVYVHIKALVDAGVKQGDIAVIAPYNLQVAFLRACLREQFPAVDVRSVDGYQGQEREAVVISFVRSNLKGVVGFLAEDRRINVALTRARRHLALVCDSKTVSHHKFMKSLIDYFKGNGVVRSAAEYHDSMDDVAFEPDLSLCKKFTGLDEVQPNKSKKEKKKTAETRQGWQQSKLDQSRHGQDTFRGQEISQQEMVVMEDVNALHTKQECETYDLMIRQKVEAELTNFLIDDSLTEYAFPASLTSFSRRAVHELADQYGLEHVSIGEGDHRQIIVRKKLDGESTVIKQQNGPEMSLLAAHTQKCKHCSKDVPTENYAIHEAQCMKKQQSFVALRPAAPLAKETLKKPKGKVGKMLEEHPNEGEDFDLLVEQFAKESKRCTQDGCKESIALLGQKCQHCGRMYCLRHAQAEVHGCGDAARAKARSEIRKTLSGVGPAKSGAPTGLQQERRRHLQSKLDKKIDGMKAQRSAPTKK